MNIRHSDAQHGAPNLREPRQRARDIHDRLLALQQELRNDVEHSDEPQFKAVLESAAEVLGGLGKAFDDYAEKNEPAWN